MSSDRTSSNRTVSIRTVSNQPDPWQLLEGAQTVLVVHAHPDDESLSTGALLAELVAAGTRVVLVTATRGEEGEIVPDAIDPGDPRPLEEIRETEIAAATSALGISERHWLGTAPALAPDTAPRRYRDSGMQWVREGLAGPSETAGADSFSLRPLDQGVDDLVALIQQVRPAAVIGYDDEGTYGHPDHVRAHQVTAAACARTGTPMVEVASGTPESDEGAEPEPVEDAEIEAGQDEDAKNESAENESAEKQSARFSWREHSGTVETVHRAVDSYRTQLTVVGVGPEGIAIRHVGGQDDLIAPRTGLRVRG